MSEKIHAFAINETHIIVKCPHYKSIKYGSGGELDNRETHRICNCDRCNYEYIIIDDDTRRIDTYAAERLLGRIK